MNGRSHWMMAGLFVVGSINGCSGGGSGTSTTAGPLLKTPVIQWATPAPVVVGTALGAAQFDATVTAPGSTTPLAGTYVYSPPSSSTGPYLVQTVGVQALSLTFIPTDTATYTTASATVVLTVTAAPVTPPAPPAPPAPTAPAYTWKNVQIVGGGYVTGIVMHPAQQGLMYARTDVGGAYRWNATTKAWIPLLDFTTRANSNQMGVESIGVDPSDATRLYLAVGEYAESFGQNGAMLVSSDQGATFTNVPLPIKIGSNDNGRGAGERLQVDPNLGTKLYFGSRNNGLYTSTDRGLTWTQVASFPVTAATSGAGVVFETFIPGTGSTGSGSKTVYAGVSALGTGTEPQSLYVSNDGGTTWAAVPGAPTGLYVSHGVLGADGNLYLTYGDQIGPNGLTTGKVYQYVLPSSTNPTGTWNDITPPRASGYQGGYGGLALDPEKPGTLMVSTLDHYYPGSDDLWRSLDYGKTWYSINTVGATRDVSLSPWITFGSATLSGTGNWPTALAIDPFDSTHVVHGSGQTILTTSDMTDSDAGSPSKWTVGAEGIEETVVLSMISPPSGPANLLSGEGDVGDFQHTDFTVSPAGGALSNPLFGNGTGLDFAQATPTIMARVGTGNNSLFGAYSSDSGTTWKPFASNPAGVTAGAGTIAVSADGATLVWEPSDATAVTSYSADQGATWKASTGAAALQPVVADRVNAKTFYVYDGSQGALLTSVDGGVTFTSAQTGLPTGGVLIASYDAAGDLWLATSKGLYHATKGGTLTALSTVTSAWGVTVGAAQSGSSTLALYVGGTVGGQAGLFRSLDNGATFIRVDDAAHEFGYVDLIQGDPRVFGRVYLGTSGRGIVYGDSAN